MADRSMKMLRGAYVRVLYAPPHLVTRTDPGIAIRLR